MNQIKFLILYGLNLIAFGAVFAVSGALWMCSKMKGELKGLDCIADGNWSAESVNTFELNFFKILVIFLSVIVLIFIMFGGNKIGTIKK